MLKKANLPLIKTILKPGKNLAQSRDSNVAKPVVIDQRIHEPIVYMKKTFRKSGKIYTTFLKGLLRRKLRGLDTIAITLNKKAFEKIDCLSCANCCKKMSPTYKKADVKRISKHLGMSFQQYYDKYLYRDDNGDYMNKSVPCQFLRKDNMCAIYAVRPKDCSGFPHTQYRDFKLYISGTHIQNIEYCPITMNVVEKMHEIVISKKIRNLNATHCE
jgi:Fe-S-cluster containining protein